MEQPSGRSGGERLARRGVKLLGRPNLRLQPLQQEWDFGGGDRFAEEKSLHLHTVARVHCVAGPLCSGCLYWAVRCCAALPVPAKNGFALQFELGLALSRLHSFSGAAFVVAPPGAAGALVRGFDRPVQARTGPHHLA
jgi:hypothetical protein